MSRQHLRQPLILISPMLKARDIIKKVNVSGLLQKQVRKSTVQEVIFSMRYREKYQQKQKQVIPRTSRTSTSRKRSDDFQDRLLQVLKKQNSLMLTRNLVNVTFVNQLQGKRFDSMRNSAVLPSSKEYPIQKQRYSTSSLAAQAKIKEREKLYYRRTCEIKEMKNAQNKCQKDFDNDFYYQEQPCIISSLKLKYRPTTSKFVEKTKDPNVKLRFTARKIQYKKSGKNSAKPIKKQDKLQPWDLQQNDQWP